MASIEINKIKNIPKLEINPDTKRPYTLRERLSKRKCLYAKGTPIWFNLWYTTPDDFRFFYKLGDTFRIKKNFYNTIGGIIYKTNDYQAGRLIKTEKLVLPFSTPIPLDPWNNKSYAILDYDSTTITDKDLIVLNPARDDPDDPEDPNIPDDPNIPNLRSKVWLYPKSIYGAYNSKQDFIDDFIKCRDEGLFEKYEKEELEVE